MGKILLFPIGTSKSTCCAASHLRRSGISLCDHPTPEATHLLLDIPSFRADGLLRTGDDLLPLLRMLPPGIQILGGNLNQPVLEHRKTFDLLQQEDFLCRNAAITAHCALKIAGPMIPTTFADTRTLIIGWGRIGKCLAQLLSGLGCHPIIAARKEKDRAMAKALGYDTADISQIPALLPQIGLLYNTAPEEILSEGQLNACPGCIKIDLASRRGLGGEDVHWARGLPGIHAPETTGRLIAETIIAHFKEETL